MLLNVQKTCICNIDFHINKSLGLKFITRYWVCILLYPMISTAYMRYCKKMEKILNVWGYSTQYHKLRDNDKNYWYKNIFVHHKCINRGVYRCPICCHTIVERWRRKLVEWPLYIPNKYGYSTSSSVSLYWKLFCSYFFSHYLRC